MPLFYCRINVFSRISVLFLWYSKNQDFLHSYRYIDICKKTGQAMKKYKRIRTLFYGFSEPSNNLLKLYTTFENFSITINSPRFYYKTSHSMF